MPFTPPDSQAYRPTPEEAASTLPDAHPGWAQALVADAPFAVAVIETASRRIVAANAAMGALMGRPPAELLDQRIASFDAFSADELAALDEKFARDGRVEAHPLQVLGPRGHTVDVFAWVSALPLGGDAYTVVWLADATERMEAQRRERERSGALQRHLKMDAIARLAGGVAHDLNNVLTVVMANAQLLGDDLVEGSPERELVREITAAGERTSAVLRELLAFSRRQVLRSVPVDVNELVMDTLPVLERLLPATVRLQTRLAPELPSIEADRAQLEQVLASLCANARNAMPAGGYLVVETTVITLDPDFAELHPGARPGRYVQLSVSDSGAGIPADVMERIFEPYVTTNPDGKGAGLGLSMVYGAVQQHGGVVDVYSEVGHGTTFKLYFPVPMPHDAAAVPSGESALGALPGGTESVLVVDDEAPVRAIGARILRRLGYHVLEAGSGEEAIALAQRHPVHMLFTDVMMPGMQGRELAERLRAEWPGLKVVFTSGYTDDVVLRHGVLGPGMLFLSKPYTAPALARMVRDALGPADERD
jgi:signal transduction histidine kinase